MDVKNNLIGIVFTKSGSPEELAEKSKFGNIPLTDINDEEGKQLISNGNKNIKIFREKLIEYYNQ